MILSNNLVTYTGCSHVISGSNFSLKIFIFSSIESAASIRIKHSLRKDFFVSLSIKGFLQSSARFESSFTNLYSLHKNFFCGSSFVCGLCPVPKGWRKSFRNLLYINACDLVFVFMTDISEKRFVTAAIVFNKI